MTARTDASTSRAARRTLVQRVAEALRERIRDGAYQPGDRLPTERDLMAEFDLSRTVVREAVATLRYVGLVEARQGAGVFVTGQPEAQALPTGADAAIFPQVRAGSASSVLEVLELRRVIEIEAAGLAAQRHSPAQESDILEKFEAFSAVLAAGEDTAEADFELHLAIANATNNPRFCSFLTLLGADLIPRQTFSSPAGAAPVIRDLQEAEREHAAIVSAILAQDGAAARAAMSLHMDRSIARYRNLLRRSLNADELPGAGQDSAG